jgi:hypothetical protein
LDEPSTQTDPSDSWKGTDAKGHPVEIRWWKQMHAKDARWLPLTIIQVTRPQAAGSERDPRISWFVYIGEEPPEGIAHIALLYCLRLGQEHGYRFDTQALLWAEPHLRTPEQFDRWTHIVASVHNLIMLTRDVVDAQLRPWENKQRKHSHQQVRRGLVKYLPQLGTPAPPPKPRGYPKGRKKGAIVHKATPFPVVRKTAKVPQIVST